VFAPTVHATSATTSATISFLNGGGTTNNIASAVVSLTATGVGPVFKGVYNSSIYTNSTAVGTGTAIAGTIPLGAQKSGVTTSFTLTISNATGDPNGTTATLTDLTLKSFTLGSGPTACTVVNTCSYGGYTVTSFSTGPITEGGTAIEIGLDLKGGLATYYDADLSFTTDQGAAYNTTGTTFLYLLTANIPEPATIVTFGMGLAGLGWARRRRAARRSAIGTDASPA
jgi:hypothetical protein